VYLPHRLADTFDDYVELVFEELERKQQRAAIFTAAVADYRPQQILPGKTPSGGALQTLELVPTMKVIARVREEHPDLQMVTFKYEENVSHERLMEIARERLEQGYAAVVANRGEEAEEAGQQVAYLVTPDRAELRLAGKPQIARAIADYLEQKA
jgi:phosphopantothenoylcysteine decarboxylase/phosphopantothenate--cysteine ligase